MTLVWSGRGEGFPVETCRLYRCEVLRWADARLDARSRPLLIGHVVVQP